VGHVASPAPPIRRALPERALAWVVTGPPGHLWSVSADVVLMWSRWSLARLRGRAP
jgi:hypothetical protein